MNNLYENRNIYFDIMENLCITITCYDKFNISFGFI